MTNKPTQQQCQAPKFACYLLACFCHGYAGESLIGDLVEEYQYRALVDPFQAKLWFWKQTVSSLLLCMSDALASQKLLKIFVVVIPFLLLPVLVAFIGWLSAFDLFPQGIEGGWQTLLRGEIHRLVIEPLIWAQFPTSISELEFDMLLHLPSSIWALVAIAGFSFVYYRQNCSAHQLAALGYSLCFLPYLLGLLYIDQQSLMAKQVGPIIAFMLISIVYLLPVISILLYRKLNTHE